ncbi:MAG: thiosulfate oxidation carrier protein SoxY [Proteobacteria bacterium]|nr:MAG: thiosulfate oxidation carrier protein SoxY [Pseudomonadota bacterium]
MRPDRRRFAKLLALMAVSGLIPAHLARAEAWNGAAFKAKSKEEFVSTLGGSGPEVSADVTIVVPEIAENGAAVPVAIVSSVANTESISILVEKNPTVLAAQFVVPNGTLPEVQTRVKMAESCDIYAVVKAAGKFYYAARPVKVTVGGCGG